MDVYNSEFDNFFITLSKYSFFGSIRVSSRPTISSIKSNDFDDPETSNCFTFSDNFEPTFHPDRKMGGKKKLERHSK